MREINTRRGRWELCWSEEYGILSLGSLNIGIDGFADLKDLAELVDSVYGWMDFALSLNKEIPELRAEVKELRAQLGESKAKVVSMKESALESWAESELKRQRDLAVSDADAMQRKLVDALQEIAELKARVEQ